MGQIDGTIHMTELEDRFRPNIQQNKVLAIIRHGKVHIPAVGLKF
jgi:hypothetical protein